MKKILFFFSLFLILGGVGLFFYTFFVVGNAKGALQVTANVESKVYLNDKYIGNTPLCVCGSESSENVKKENKELFLQAGDYTVRLVPITGNFGEYQDSMKIGKSVLTVVDRKFLSGATSEGSVIFLTPLSDEKKIGLSVISVPEGADVLLDSENIGKTALSLDSITNSDHSLLIQKEGYKTKELRISAASGYMLSAKVYLGIDTKSLESKVASSEATPTPTLGVARVEILETGTGFLRVRDSNSLAGKEVTRVNPGEMLELVEEKEGWYQVKLKDGTLGWVSSQFARKVE